MVAILERVTIMKKSMLISKRVGLLLLAMILLGTILPVGAVAVSSDNEWEANVMVEKPLDFIVKKEKVVSVTFLDTLEAAPGKPWNLGPLGARDSVQGWVEWKYGQGHVYIAAEGGINGKDACEELFMDCEALKEVNFNGAFHTDEAESMTNMFYNCYALEDVDLDQLNTANVTSMYQMFRNCVSLEELDVSRMNTSEVETMYCMFSTCSSLEELDLSSFDTGNVTNMAYMFSVCTELEKVNVSSFDTSEVTYMAGMFRWCNELEEYDFSSWDVSNVTNYAGFMNDGMKINGKDWEKFFK